MQTHANEANSVMVEARFDQPGVPANGDFCVTTLPFRRVLEAVSGLVRYGEVVMRASVLGRLGGFQLFMRDDSPLGTHNCPLYPGLFFT